MSKQEHAEGFELDVLCSPEKDAYRIYVWPTWVPAYLRSCLDFHCEAYPVNFNIHELDNHMLVGGVAYEKRECANDTLSWA
jgi:hypothetical protein